MRLLKNLRGGITQIVKRYAKVDIDNTEQATGSSEGIYYLDANNLYGGVLHASNDAVRIGGCIWATRSDGEDQSWSEWMGTITQDVRQVRILHRVWYRGTSGTPWQVQWSAILPRTEGGHVLWWNQEVRSEERHRGQSERGEYTEAHLRSCTSSKVSRTLLSVAIGSSTGISRNSHPPPHSIQTGTIHIRICQYAEWETSQVQNHNGEEPVQAVGKLHLWQIRGDWAEMNEGEVR